MEIGLSISKMDTKVTSGVEGMKTEKNKQQIAKGM